MTFSIVIPAYNEERGIELVLRTLLAYFKQHAIDAEIIVVNDGSTDKTAAVVSSFEQVRLLSHPYNKGYGASIKTGINAAQSDWCITYDADNQHTPDLLSLLFPHCRELNHMVVGKREGYRGPWIRQPGKRLLSWVANYLTQKKIPDLNSGLRAFRRTEFLRFQHLFPNGFSLSTTSTVCFFKENLNVVYVPIRINPRIGKSTVQISDAPRTFLLILRLIMLFSPLRIFLPASAFFGLLVIADMVYEFSVTGYITNKSTMALFSLMSLTFFFGLLADQMAAIRREIGKQRD